MWDMIYAFGVGIAFSVGVGVGAVLCRMATNEGRTNMGKDIQEYNDKLLSVLTARELNDQAIIVALGRIADK